MEILFYYLIKRVKKYNNINNDINICFLLNFLKKGCVIFLSNDANTSFFFSSLFYY